MTALPTRKLEAWRYTDLRPLAEMSFADAAPFTGRVEFPEINAPTMVLLNGLVSSTTIPVGGIVETSDGDLPLELINAASAQAGLNVEIAAGIDAGTYLLVSQSAADTAFAAHPYHVLSLAERAVLTLIEVVKGQGKYWQNEVMHVRLARGARLTHIRVQDESLEAFSSCTVRCALEENATYEHFSATLGAKLSRTEIHVALNGTGATAHLGGAQLLRGAQHGDFTFVLRHAAPGCQSRQLVRSVLDDNARGVFQGRIEVAKAAQKTDGYQMSRALLLSPHAEMDIKPELEIFADDVKCSHGATIGALDGEQLFYLRSRGIEEEQARAILVRAFLEEALEPVRHERAREILEVAIEGWWQGK